MIKEVQGAYAFGIVVGVIGSVYTERIDWVLDFTPAQSALPAALARIGREYGRGLVPDDCALSPRA